MKQIKKSECLQFSCTFHPESETVPVQAREMLSRLCPVCSVCKAEPHVIGEGCKNCMKCEYQEGFVRDGEPKDVFEEVKNRPLKEKERELVEVIHNEL